MEREEEFREETINQIKRLKLKVNGLYILVFVLVVFISALGIINIYF